MPLSGDRRNEKQVNEMERTMEKVNVEGASVREERSLKTESAGGCGSVAESVPS